MDFPAGRYMMRHIDTKMPDMFIADLDRQFQRLHTDSTTLLRALAPERLYWKPEAEQSVTPIYSCGEYLLRSAGGVERTFGGLTANLWDDPFEWTLPEVLRSPVDLLAYFDEVEATRRRGFALLKTDEELARVIALSPDEFKPLGELLLDTLTRAVHWQGNAFAIYSLFSDLPANRP